MANQAARSTCAATSPAGRSKKEEARGMCRSAGSRGPIVRLGTVVGNSALVGSWRVFQRRPWRPDRRVAGRWAHRDCCLHRPPARGVDCRQSRSGASSPSHVGGVPSIAVARFSRPVTVAPTSGEQHDQRIGEWAAPSSDDVVVQRLLGDLEIRRGRPLAVDGFAGPHQRGDPEVQQRNPGQHRTAGSTRAG